VKTLSISRFENEDLAEVWSLSCANDSLARFQRSWSCSHMVGPEASRYLIRESPKESELPRHWSIEHLFA